MADIVREIEITAAISSDYQAAFKAASSIAQDTASELAKLTKREADLAKLAEIAGKSAQASAQGDAKAVAALDREYSKLADKLSLADRSAAGVAKELESVGARKKEVEELNRAAGRQAEFGRIASEIKKYTEASKKIKDPAINRHLTELQKKFVAMGGTLKQNQKEASGFFSKLKSGIMQGRGPIGDVARTVGSLGDAFKTGGGRAMLFVAGAAAVTAAAIKAGKVLWDLGRDAITSGDAIAKTSKQLGINAEAYQELAYAAGLGGASESDFSGALQNLNRQMEAAASGNKKAQQAFKTLGVSMDEVKSMNTEEMFLRLSDALSEVDNVAAHTKTTMALFGGGGTKVAEAISGGADALERMREEARKAGYVMDNKTLKKAEDANDNLTRAQLQLRGVMRQIGAEVLPTVNETLTEFIQLIRDNQGSITEFAQLIGSAFRGGCYIAVEAIKGVNAAIHIIGEGIKFWQDKFAGMLLWIHDSKEAVKEWLASIPGAISEMASKIYARLSEWFSSAKSAVAGWISDIADSIVQAVMDKVAWLTESLHDIPLIGRLFDEPTEGASGGITVNINNSVDARGAEPGAAGAIGRAVSGVSAPSGEAAAKALAGFARLSLAG